MTATLIVGPSWVGDMVMAQGLIMALKQRDPEPAVDVVAPAWSVPLLERMPEVRGAIVLDVAHGELGWGKRRALGRSLCDRGYDQALVLPRSLKSALVPWFARIPERTGYRGEWRYGLLNDVRRLDRERLPEAARRWLALAYPPDTPVPASVPAPRMRPDRANQQALTERLNLRTDRPVVALMPGAEYGSAKRWPAERYATVAKRLAERGVSVWVFGSPAERALGETVVAEAGEQAVNLCGRTRLPDAVDLLALADAAVSNDSGLMHVAGAVGAFVVAIYGPTSPRYTPPLTDHGRILYRDLECSPCFARECPLGHHNCMLEISPARVLDALPALDQNAAS